MIEFDFDALRRIGLNNFIISRLADAPDQGQLMRVTEVQRDRCTLHDGQQELPAHRHPHELLLVGDWVLAEHNIHNQLWITFRLEPATELTRRTAEGRRQSLVSNIDTALLVMGLDHDFNLRRIERYIALAKSAEITPVIVLSKADIAEDIIEKVTQLTQRLPNSIDYVTINGTHPDAIDVLLPWLGAGQTVCLLGSSGAGKSTLTNTLCACGQDTGSVRADDSRGRHTTTARSLHISSHGACIIDTPGLRALCPESLSSAFEDIEELAQNCQFRDCRHDAEPGCAVREAVHPDRLRNYHKLVREIQRTQQTPLERIAERAKWKSLLKSVAARNQDRKRS
jgi:ribosome biogenesis GTPase